MCLRYRPPLFHSRCMLDVSKIIGWDSSASGRSRKRIVLSQRFIVFRVQPIATRNPRGFCFSPPSSSGRSLYPPDFAQENHGCFTSTSRGLRRYQSAGTSRPGRCSHTWALRSDRAIVSSRWKVDSFTRDRRSGRQVTRKLILITICAQWRAEISSVSSWTDAF